MCVSVCACHFKVARERPRGASGAQRSGRPSWEPCRAEGGPHRQRHHHRRRRRVGWEGREPPLPPPPPGWAPFSVDAGDPGRGKRGVLGEGWGCRRPRLTCGRWLGRRARASLRHSERRRRAKDTGPASEDIFGQRPRPRVRTLRPGVDARLGVIARRPSPPIAPAGRPLRQDFCCCDES